MLKIKCDINKQDLKRVDLHFVKSEQFSLTWSCGSRQRGTTSSGWKFSLNNLAVKGLKHSIVFAQTIESKGFFQFKIIIKVLVNSLRFI